MTMCVRVNMGLSITLVTITVIIITAGTEDSDNYQKGYNAVPPKSNFLAPKGKAISSPWNFAAAWRELDHSGSESESGRRRSIYPGDDTYNAPTYNNPGKIEKLFVRPRREFKNNPRSRPSKYYYYDYDVPDKPTSTLGQGLGKSQLESLIGIPILTTLAMTGLQMYLTSRKIKTATVSNGNNNTLPGKDSVENSGEDAQTPTKKNKVNFKMDVTTHEILGIGTGPGNHRQPRQGQGGVSGNQYVSPKKTFEITKHFNFAKESESLNRARMFQDMDFLNVLWNIEKIPNPKNVTAKFLVER